MIYEVSMVPAPDFCILPARSSRKYKSLTMFQWFQHLAFVLWQSCQLESTNDLRSIKGSGACSLYFGILYLAAWGEYGANAGVHLCKSAFVCPPAAGKKVALLKGTAAYATVPSDPVSSVSVNRLTLRCWISSYRDSLGDGVHQRVCARQLVAEYVA